jgi:phytoene dehydrogenase-like protein
VQDDAQRYDTLILGAGMSGLAAGIRLAQAGLRVAVLERHSLWGGLNSFYKLGGRRFDTGLHALTNWFRAGERRTPLARVLRALRIEREELELGEQSWSHVSFLVGSELVRLRFSNDLELLRSQVAARFPSELGGFERLLADLPGFDGPRQSAPGARAELARRIRDPLLCEMLLCPVALYGNARDDDDMDWDAFGVLFRSIFLEGLCRPAGGIRALLDVLRRRLKEEGGELRTNCGVRHIVLRGERAVALELEDGSELSASSVLSSAGLVETLRLAGRSLGAPTAPRAGRISVLEVVSVLDRPTRALGHEATVGFFNRGEVFHHRAPSEPCALEAGVTCSPDNYAGQRDLPEGRLRVTVLANPDAWQGLDEERYVSEKARWSERCIESALPFAFDPRPHEVQRDAFTPRTIRHFTGHDNGALYGSPDKRRAGDIGLENVWLIGNDEAYPGIVGALASGVGVSSRALRLAPAASAQPPEGP